VIYLKDAHKRKYTQMGLKISYYRKLKGLSQEQLAEIVGKSLAFIGAVEAPNIVRAISMDTLFDIADVLEVPAYKFLQFDEYGTPKHVNHKDSRRITGQL
jgi:transcriptional regulator with XRE-family HTH domain